MITSYQIRSIRAPYRRAGLTFTSTREPLEVPADQLSDDQLAVLEEDPAILIVAVETITAPESDAPGNKPDTPAPPADPVTVPDPEPAPDDGNDKLPPRKGRSQ